jgi:flagellar protein FlgJ
MDNLLDLQMNNAIAGARQAEAARLPAAGSDTAARQAAEEFESVFISQMLEAMFAQVDQDSPFGGGPGERAFTGLLHEEYAKVMQQSGGLGFADRLTSEILRYQEAGGETE